jgi:hypothetical protein
LHGQPTGPVRYAVCVHCEHIAYLRIQQPELSATPVSRTWPAEISRSQPISHGARLAPSGGRLYAQRRDVARRAPSDDNRRPTRGRLRKLGDCQTPASLEATVLENAPSIMRTHPLHKTMLALTRDTLWLPCSLHLCALIPRNPVCKALVTSILYVSVGVKVSGG